MSAARDTLVAIADDEPVACELLARLVAACPGFQVHWTAHDGSAACERALHSPPDVLMLDIRMPGMNGIDVARRLREAGRHTRIILVTAHEEFAYATAAIRLNVVDYLVKPVDEGMLLEALDRARHAAGRLESPTPSGESLVGLASVIGQASQSAVWESGMRAVLAKSCDWVKNQGEGLYLFGFSPSHTQGAAQVLFQHTRNTRKDDAAGVLWRLLLRHTGVPFFFASLPKSRDLVKERRMLFARITAAGAHHIAQAAARMADVGADLALEAVALDVHVSPEHLSRLFPQLTGQTFMQFRLQMRLEAALELLYGSTESSTEIGRRCGFQYSHHFARQFRQRFGVSPTEFRRGLSATEE